MRAIRRETRDTLFECSKVRTMMVEIHQGTVRVWPKGTRRKQIINLAAAWQRAVKAEVEAERRARKRKRQPRRRKR